MRKTFVLDTSVVGEYLNEDSPLGVEHLFDLLALDTVKAYVTPVTLSEVIYVASRIYAEAGVRDPNTKALELVEWLLALPGVVFEPVGRDVALAVGELRKKFKLALPDLYVIATGMQRDASPLFLKLEAEMKTYENKLRKLGVTFWEEARSQFL